MKNCLWKAVLGYLTLVGVVANAVQNCPSTIRYTNGSYLKNGDSFYYQDGSRLAQSGRIYYPTGTALKNSDSIYYPNGSYLQRGSALYYPTGNYLRNGDRIYYANGNPLKSGTSFYYASGNRARMNGRLYREDGSETPFPVTLEETIGEYGHLTAEVRASTEMVDYNFKDLVVQSGSATVTALWNGNTFFEVEARLNTGLAKENVVVRFTNNGLFCSLEEELNPSPEFTIHSQAADVRVKVAPGYDPREVKMALENALNSIWP